MIFVLKVSANKEDQVLDLLSEKIEKKNLNVYSIVRPFGLKGYIFIEADSKETVEEAVFNSLYVKSILPTLVNYDEIKNMVEPETAPINIEKGDIVEIIGDTFKKEKAKITRIDKAKGEVVVELLEATVPIPITLKIDNVRVIRREKEEQ